MPLLQKELSFLEKSFDNSDKLAASISSNNVSWHIDHCLKVITKVCSSLISSNASEYKWKFNKWRFVIFLKGSIPRGKAKSPKQVLPPENIKIKDLKIQLKEVKLLLKTVEQLPLKNYFNHHILGKLHLKKTIRFLEIHTNHHIKIIKDIVKN
ncbi:DUF1569 domain-containing protein [Aureibaculum marinum]|uniref:DUF1569 domain-containing protein n=1 Tax=Aureibaculum marinum TaxID=2487930 RepID=A0A3N4P7Q6_9FLAO|nr:DUF1569 domain-containing protein [Aureibaculum marinum]RPE00887.1 DUF1569 domain-containing protein [Aureibaculum marinum]